MTWPKRCSKCQRDISPAEWLNLPLAGAPEKRGRQEVPADPDDPMNPEPYVLIMRNHDCGTTLVVREDEEKAINA